LPGGEKGMMTSDYRNAKAVRDWAFRNTDYPALYSYCKYTNEPSFRTAESIGMRFACEYPDEINGKTHVSMITIIGRVSASSEALFLTY